MTKPTKTTEPKLHAPLEAIVDTIRDLHIRDPFVLAAFVDYIRQEWDGEPLPARVGTVKRCPVSEWIQCRAIELRHQALRYAAESAVRAAVQS